METMIKIEHVTKSFYNEILLDDLTLTANKGDIIGIIGENGCGKSVLFKMICGFISPESGTIEVMGRNITGGNFPLSTGIFLDGTGFIPYASAFDNMKNIAVIDNRINDAQIRAVLKTVRLNPDSKKPVKKYSLGMKQRLGIAMALMENPRLLLLDEPFNALDKEMAETIRNLLLEKNKTDQVTIMLTSHNEKDIQLLCSHVYKIENYKLEQLY